MAAATALAELVDEVESSRTAGTADDAVLHSVTDLRLMLARAYFQSAQLGRAEATLNEVIEHSPTDSYAHLLLGRTLQRAGRHAEAARPLALAEILGDYERPEAYGTTATTAAGPTAPATPQSPPDPTSRRVTPSSHVTGAPTLEWPRRHT